MPKYELRDVPPDLWSKFTERASRENWPTRAVLIQLMYDYADGRIAPSGASPQSMSIDWMMPVYLSIAGTDEFKLAPRVRQWELLLEALKRHRLGNMKDYNAMPESRQLQTLSWLDHRARSLAAHRDRPTLTLRAIAHATLPDGRRSAVNYEVLGLPPNEQAWIGRTKYHWQILRATHGQQDVWKGEYSSAAAALNALTDEIAGA